MRRIKGRLIIDDGMFRFVLIDVETQEILKKSMRMPLHQFKKGLCIMMRYQDLDFRMECKSNFNDTKTLEADISVVDPTITVEE